MSQSDKITDIDQGLRGYLLSKKTREAQVLREFWSLNDSTYEAYRKYTRHVKEFGFPDIQQQVELQRKSSTLPGQHSRKSSVVSDTSTSMVMRTVSWRSQGPQFSFKGMRAVLDDCKNPITILSFGRLSSALLAWASSQGEIYVADLDKGPQTTKLGQKDRIMDLDWSQDNQFILTAGLDRQLCLWNVSLCQCVRSITCKHALNCCRFHSMNYNILLCGGNGGFLEAYNSSTGSLLQMTDVRDVLEEVNVTAMACSNTCMYVGDSVGNVHILQCEIRNGVLTPLMFMSRTPYPKPKSSEIIRIVYQGYCAFSHGPSLLCSALDGYVFVFKVYDTVGRLELAAQVQMPTMARRIYTIWCPATSLEDPECIVTGGEDTCITIYDIGRVLLGGQVMEVNRLQGHSSPVVDVCWSYDEQSLASADCNGMVIVWRRERRESGLSSRRISISSWG
eukprot:TRINITY_DN52728_c0_g2_i4.p1 TRINITY_DN52728_c0_g2~~TRINITY_DN52728_c0_g2_i4.p1  ORF type:complete len:449 (-),score=27.13 TRINITY_DN52728_c0_g2_i4:184-1530(-)